MARCLLAFLGMAAIGVGCCAAWDHSWSAVPALWLGATALLVLFIWTTALRPVLVEKGRRLHLVSDRERRAP